MLLVSFFDKILLYLADSILLAAVAAHLALYAFTLKTDPPSRFNPNLKESIPEKITLKPIQESKEWNEGALYAYAQNLARTVSLVCFFFWCTILIPIR